MQELNEKNIKRIKGPLKIEGEETNRDKMTDRARLPQDIFDWITEEDQILSTASYTTNCIAPLLYLLEKEYGMASGFMSTIHAFTMDQMLQMARTRTIEEHGQLPSQLYPPLQAPQKLSQTCCPVLKASWMGSLIGYRLLTAL